MAYHGPILKRTFWTEKNREILQKLYPNASIDEILKNLPDATWHACQKEASRLGIRRLKTEKKKKLLSPKGKLNLYDFKEVKRGKKCPTWTDEEHEILQIFFPRSSQEIILDTLPKKYWIDICMEAEKLGIKRLIEDKPKRKKRKKAKS
jgi:hypothetical protein